MSALRVSLVQQPLVWQDPPANRERFSALLTPLARAAPISSCCRRPSRPASAWKSSAWRSRRRTDRAVAAGAGGARLDAAITGSVITAEDGKYYNRLLWADPAARCATTTSATCFAWAASTSISRRGAAPGASPGAACAICPLVCYDLRFPVFSRRRPELDYDVLVYVANWPAARAEAWRAAAAGTGHREPGLRGGREPGRGRRRRRCLRAVTARRSISSGRSLSSPRRGRRRSAPWSSTARRWRRSARGFRRTWTPTALPWNPDGVDFSGP